VLTISRLSRWSINYYNDTANAAQAAAMDRQSAGGGLGEYYSESDTRVPTWVVVGDTAAVGELTGLDAAALHGGFADTAVAARWLDDGIAPNGASGRGYTTGSVHGFDLTFAAPKSVSLLRALTDDIGEKTMLAAHQKGIDAAMTYLHQHAGYTRVHNPLTGRKDLQRLPGLVGIAYQHETSRCGDPHLHTHVIVELVDAPGDPRALIEQITDMVGVRVSAARAAHHREGHELFTVDAVIAEETRIFDMIDTVDTRARLDVRTTDLRGLSADQARAIASIGASPYVVQPLQAPAGAGKTHSLQALRAGAHRANKEVLVLAPTGNAVDEAMRDEAGDRGLTVAKALHLIEEGQLRVDRRTVIVVDEASMVGTPELRRLLEASTAGRAKIVLVGDAYQLAPVKARGGMFEQLCEDLPWAQRLGEVWRLRDPAERDASLALRSARGHRLRKAIGWYRNHDRLHTGDQVAMATDATTAYLTARAEGKDVAILCDTWEIADAINQRLHDHFTSADAPSVPVARDQHVRAGDLILSRHNDAALTVKPGTQHRRGERIDQVRNGNRWRVLGVDVQRSRIAAERLTDRARVVFEGDYLREHITLGYASTVHSAQGMTIGRSNHYGICRSILSDRASRAMAYVGMTRGRDGNHLAIYPAVTNEAHQHHHGADTAVHQMRRGTKNAAAHYFRMILANDDRARTMHTVAARTDRELLPTTVAALLDRNDQRRAARVQGWGRHSAETRAREAAYQRITATRQQATQRQRSRSRGRDHGYGLEL